MMGVSIQHEDFDPGVEIDKLRKPEVGAVVSFTGFVRDFNANSPVSAIKLEHYPAMTEKSLSAIIEEARSRWNMSDASIIHRIGELKACERIVFVAVSSAHRKDAFAACEFLIDRLKTDAPFWKKEITPKGEMWVGAKASDEKAAAKWRNE